MNARNRSRTALPLFFVALLVAAIPAAANSSHARIVRLSFVQGQVRYTHTKSADALADSKAAWVEAILNLPLRQGDALATDDGRAEVEFENGVNAYMDAHSVLEFYDLSLDEGVRVTRLVVRQGSAAFRVNGPAGDYFSVTGGDFTVEAPGHATFRVNNYDDGSAVRVTKGVVAAITPRETKQLAKGNSLSLRAGDKTPAVVAILDVPDDFDMWVSVREENTARAVNASSQYLSATTYSAGLADLYGSGSWFMYPGYGYCWQPFSAGLGWSPFQNGGSWMNFAGLGWTWVGGEPWGWLPYHFGGWLFAPGRGWIWSPGGVGGNGPIGWRPATAVFVRSGDTVGIVPANPRDAKGKPPLNLAQGVMPASGLSPRTAPRSTTSTAGSWQVIKKPARDLAGATSALAPAAPPARVSRSMVAMQGGTTGVGISAPISSDAHVRAGQASVPASTASRTSSNATPRVSPPPRSFTPAPAYSGSASASQGGTRGGSSGGSGGSSSAASASSGSHSSSGSGPSSGASSAPRSAPSSAPASSGRAR